MSRFAEVAADSRRRLRPALEKTAHGSVAVVRSRTVSDLRRALRAFSEAGRVVALAGVGAWVVAAVTGWREFAMLAGICIVLCIVALASTMGKDELEVELSLTQHRVVVGEAAAGRVHVVNRAARRSGSAVMRVPVGDGAVSLAVPRLAHGEVHDDVFIIPAHRRAVLQVGPASTVRGDALGLAARRVEWSSSTTLYVHPKTVRLLGTASGWIKDMEGQSRKELSSSDVVFEALREYVPGDDMRHIHWKTYARTGELMVRQFVDTRRSQLGVVLSARSNEYLDPDEFELAVSVAGSLGLSAIQDRQEVVCLVGDKALPAFSQQRFLDGLAGVDALATAPNILESVQRGRLQMRRSSVVLVVSGGAINPAVLRAAADRCGSHARVIAVQVHAGAEPHTRRIGLHTLLTVGSLDHLRRLTRTLAA